MPFAAVFHLLSACFLSFLRINMADIEMSKIYVLKVYCFKKSFLSAVFLPESYEFVLKGKF